MPTKGQNLQQTFEAAGAFRLRDIIKSPPSGVLTGADLLAISQSILAIEEHLVEQASNPVAKATPRRYP
jgi:hypothetical protein